MKFGEKVRDLRKKHSLTQDELAQCLGINKRTIIGWERDGRYPRSIEMLEKMADIFHVPLTYLQPDQSLSIASWTNRQSRWCAAMPSDIILSISCLWTCIP